MIIIIIIIIIILFKDADLGVIITSIIAIILQKS